MGLDNVSDILMGDNVVPFSTSIKYLSLVITNTLDWNEHVKNA